MGTIGVLLVAILAIVLSNSANEPRGGSSPTSQPEPPDVRRIATLPGAAKGTQLAFSPDGRVLASGDVGKLIKWWDVTPIS